MQDLLDPDRNVRPDRAAQRVEIGAGVAQPVDMVDAQPGDGAFGDQLQRQAVDVVEYVGRSTRTPTSSLTSKKRR
jgi:hypothetical protein